MNYGESHLNLITGGGISRADESVRFRLKVFVTGREGVAGSLDSLDGTVTIEGEPFLEEVLTTLVLTVSSAVSVIVKVVMVTPDHKYTPLSASTSIKNNGVKPVLSECEPAAPVEGVPRGSRAVVDPSSSLSRSERVVALDLPFPLEVIKATSSQGCSGRESLSESCQAEFFFVAKDKRLLTGDVNDRIPSARLYDPGCKSHRS